MIDLDKSQVVKHYLEAGDNYVEGEESCYDYIDPNPRHDIVKALTLSHEIPVSKIRNDLEQLIGINLLLKEGGMVFARGARLYILPTDLPQGMLESHKEMIGEGKHYNNIAAVFVRAATNPYVKSGAYECAGKMLLGAFKQLLAKYDGEEHFTFFFKEPYKLMNVLDVMRDHDTELAQNEFPLVFAREAGLNIRCTNPENL